MDVTLRYFSEFGKHVPTHNRRVDLWRNLCTSLLYFVSRVRCRRKESSRSLSHPLMSFLFNMATGFVLGNVTPRRCHQFWSYWDLYTVFQKSVVPNFCNNFNNIIAHRCWKCFFTVGNRNELSTLWYWCYIVLQQPVMRAVTHHVWQYGTLTYGISIVTWSQEHWAQVDCGLSAGFDFVHYR